MVLGNWQAATSRHVVAGDAGGVKRITSCEYVQPELMFHFARIHRPIIRFAQHTVEKTCKTREDATTRQFHGVLRKWVIWRVNRVRDRAFL